MSEPMHPLIRRLEHALRQRDIHWDDMSDAGRRLMNRAVDTCMKDAVEVGLHREARDAAWAWDEARKELGIGHKR